MTTSGRVGLTVFNYPILAQRTELGPRSVPLTGLSELSANLRSIVIPILLSDQVQRFLSVSEYTPSIRETIPITSLQPEPFAPRAA